MSYWIKCPKCNREYLYNHCLAKSSETEDSKRKNKRKKPCAHCQEPYRSEK